MAQIVKELRVDVSQPNVFQAIVAKQHDSNSRFLKITLVDFGVKVEVPNTAKVTINANRPDGASESFKGEANNDGTITVPLAQWMLDIDGEVKCDVSVTNTEDNKRLTSTDFWLEVQKAANPNASIPLDPDGEILIIKPVSEINKNSKDTDYPSAKAVYDYGQDILNTPVTATATGSAITIESSQAPLQNLKLFGKTTQDGTPTPTSPIELKSVGDSGSFEVGVYGRNLLEIPFNAGYTFSAYGITYTVQSDKSISVSGTPTQSSVYPNFNLSAYKFSLPIGKYKFVCEGLKSPYNLYPLLYYLNENNQAETIATFWGKHVNNVEFTITEKNKDNIWFCLGCVPTYTPQGERVYVSIFKVDETDTSYEPCNKQTLTMPYTLRSVPYIDSSEVNLTDEIDFTNALRTENTIKITLNGTETIQEHAGGMLYIPLYNIDKFKGGCGLCDQLTNAFIATATGEVFNIGARGIYIGKCSKYSTPEELKAYLTSNPMTFIVGLETPIETALTEQELNAYRSLMTNSGNTTILSEADMEVDYYVNKPNAQAIGNLHTQINKDYFKLQQAIISTGGSTL